MNVPNHEEPLRKKCRTDQSEEDGSSMAALREFRIKNGLCYRCGTLLYKIRPEGPIEALSIPGVVNNGRCCYCYPESDRGVSARLELVRLGQAEPSASPERLKKRRMEQGSSRTHDGNEDNSNKIAKHGHHNASTTQQGPKVEGSSERTDDANNKKPAISSFFQPRQAARPSRPIRITIQDADGLDFEGPVFTGTAEKGKGSFVHVLATGDEGKPKYMTYEGQFQNGKLHGKGCVRDERAGCTFEGEFRYGAANGPGTCEWDNGWKYKGEWKNDKRHGKGVCQQLVEGGEAYYGEWVADKWEGKGTLKFCGGGQYVGEFKRNKLEGHGTYEFFDGSVYKGEFKNDIRDGDGCMTYADGVKYVGDWKNNWRNGRGTLYYPDDTMFKGTFRDDEKHGTGYLHLPDGIAKKEKWQNGDLV